PSPISRESRKWGFPRAYAGMPVCSKIGRVPCPNIEKIIVSRGEVIMRSLLKISVICAAIVLLVVYRSDIGSKVSDWWDGVVPQSTSHPLEGSVQRAGA